MYITCFINWVYVIDCMLNYMYMYNIYVHTLFVDTANMCSSNYSLRLVNGSTADEGRVEFCYNNVWTTYCGLTYISQKTASTLCSQLGYQGNDCKCAVCVFVLISIFSNFWIFGLICDCLLLTNYMYISINENFCSTWQRYE